MHGMARRQRAAAARRKGMNVARSPGVVWALSRRQVGSRRGRSWVKRGDTLALAPLLLFGHGATEHENTSLDTLTRGSMLAVSPHHYVRRVRLSIMSYY